MLYEEWYAVFGRHVRFANDTQPEIHWLWQRLAMVIVGRYGGDRPTVAYDHEGEALFRMGMTHKRREWFGEVPEPFRSSVKKFAMDVAVAADEKPPNLLATEEPK